MSSSVTDNVPFPVPSPCLLCLPSIVSHTHVPIIRKENMCLFSRHFWGSFCCCGRALDGRNKKINTPNQTDINTHTHECPAFKIPINPFDMGKWRGACVTSVMIIMRNRPNSQGQGQRQVRDGKPSLLFISHPHPQVRPVSVLLCCLPSLSFFEQASNTLSLSLWKKKKQRHIFLEDRLLLKGRSHLHP